MQDIVFYADTTGEREEVGRLRPDGGWTGEERLYEDVTKVASKYHLDILSDEGRQTLMKWFSGAYLWAVMEMEDATKK
jgi:hypothetical protein